MRVDTRFSTAAEMLSTHIRPSRLIASAAAADLFLKLECELPTGSFKVRGAMYALAVNLQGRQIREVVASSTGNHGAAVAYAANRHGVAATIFLPRNTQQRLRSLRCLQLRQYKDRFH